MFTVVEPLAVLGVAYLSYLSAELFHFSGIIRYVLNNIQISLSRQKINCFLYNASFPGVKLIAVAQTCVKVEWIMM
jgi:hypothetical protein